MHPYIKKTPLKKSERELRMRQTRVGKSGDISEIRNERQNSEGQTDSRCDGSLEQTWIWSWHGQNGRQLQLQKWRARVQCVCVRLHLQTLCAVVRTAVLGASVLPVTTKTQGVKTEDTADTVCHETYLKETHNTICTQCDNRIIIFTELLILLNDICVALLSLHCNYQVLWH